MSECRSCRLLWLSNGVRRPQLAAARTLPKPLARRRYEDAARLWFQALGEGFDYSVLDRNLGVYAWRVKGDRKSAAGFYAKAIQLAPGDYRLYTDLDEIYAQIGDTARRADVFAK